MTLLTIARDLAKDVGLAIPDQVISSPLREWKEAVTLSNDAGEELARRVDWGALRGETTLTGDGTNKAFALPQFFSRITPGAGVYTATGILRPLTRAEWGSLAPVEGAPRFFLLAGNKITLWPYLATGQTATVSYQSSAWASNGTNAWAADTETSLIDEGLMRKGLIVRWRRQSGMDYADHEAEYEATLAAFAEYDDRSRL